MKNLDTILSTSSPGSVIELDAGTYTTTGAHLKPGVEMIGQGKGITVIKLIPDRTREMTVLLGDGNNTVSNLTVDCGCENPKEEWSQFKTNGVFLTGTDNLIDHVDVVRPFGNYSRMQECFPIMAHGSSVIDHCQVRDVCGTYVSAICGCGGILENCSSIFPEVRYEPEKIVFHMGFNCGPGVLLRVENNISVNATSGFYSDWMNTDNIVVTGNTFYNCRFSGVLIKMQYIEGSPPQLYKNARFIKNKIELSAEETYHICAFMFDNTRSVYSSEPICHGGIQDIEVSENEVTTKDNICVAQHRQFTNIASLCPSPTDTSGCRNYMFRDNRYPQSFTWRHKNAQNVKNYKLEKVEVPIAWT